LFSPARLFRLTGIEIAKLRRQRLTAVVLAVPVLAAGLIPLALRSAGAGELAGFLALARALELSLLVASILVLLQAALALSWERSQKTLREAVAAPVTRGEIILSRWLVLELTLLALILLAVAVALFSTALQYRFDDVRAEAVAPLFYKEELWEGLGRALVYHLPAAAALVTLGLLVSVLSATPAVAASLAVGALLFLDVAKSVFSRGAEAPPYLFNAYLPTFFDESSYLHGVTALANGIGDVVWSEDSPRHALVFAVPLACAAGFLAIALVIFQRKEFAE
jgi:ABC-type transport system involved in multi-copper enzyme maturation permease subunit